MRIPFIHKKIPFIVILYLLISFFVITVWVRGDVFLSHAENGLLLYNNQKTLELTKSFWQENDFGKPSSLNFPGITLAWYAATLEKVGFTESLIQGILLFILISTAFISMHYVVKELFPKEFHLIPFIASLFYFGNLYTLTQIWMRFLYTQFFVWSYLPLFLLMWMRWITFREKIYLFWIVVTSFVFSYVYVGPTSVFVLWIPAVLFSFFELLITKDRRRQIIIATLVGMVVWSASNAWWIYPVWALKDTAYSGMLDPLANFKSLEVVSQYFPVDQILLLRQTFLLGEKSHLYPTYITQSSYVIGYFIMCITFCGFFVLLQKKKYFIPMLAFISFFIIKGIHPPFGREFYSLIFEHIEYLQMFRNPYEKFGVVFMFSYVILCAIGLAHISDIFKKIKYVLFIVGMYYSIIVLPQPLWSGLVFPEHYYISVPNYYSKINSKIADISDGTILQLPFLRDAGISYTWKYEGEEPSVYLFNNASSSRSYNRTKGDAYYDRLPYYIKNQHFPNILANAGISSLVLHEDTLVKNGQESVEDTRQLIRNWDGVTFVTKESQLELYISNNYRGKIFAANIPTRYESNDEMFQLMLNEPTDNSKIQFYLKSDIYDVVDTYEFGIPKLTHIKKNSGHYQIYASDVSDPFVLVLTQTYHPSWVATIYKEGILKHFEVNGFANGWIIDRKGDYTIDVVFKVWPWE